MKPIKETDGDLNAYLGPNSNKEKKNDKNQSMMVKPEGIYPHKISIMGKGNMLCEEDVFALRNCTTSVKCVSMTGELLVMKTIDFY